MKETRDFCIKYYDYYREAYGAVLGGMVGEYEREYPVSTEESEGSEGSEAAMEWKKVYGLKNDESKKNDVQK